ncbi:MAG: rane-bound dehydrogenase protein, partial [Bryobacterales bacterium]|nr:rane-bound dehydrogenase protein [Bryobacterales bacterium]
MTLPPFSMRSVRARLLLATVISISAVGVSLIAQTIAKKGHRIEVLVLGSENQEHSTQRVTALLVPALAKEGFNFSWASDPTDLNASNLGKYDTLMVYGNFESLTPAQERALTAFVESGKGLVAVHSASDSFRNSTAWAHLLGGQHESHQPGTVSAAVTQVQHPVTREVAPFETTDEAYTHKGLSSDRTVLMDRTSGTKREPVTWARTQGKGRVVYTALGHDEPTWQKPEFQALIRGAILWSVGDSVRARWDELDMPAISYRTSSLIPNYERRARPPRLQAPLSPQNSMKTMQVPPGFEVQLFASEPDIIKPISMNWDERGRLWILESVDYPNELHPGTPGRDRIKICEDTDGDGKADKFTVFAEGLNVPTGLMLWNGGVVVGSAPDILFLKDTNGDDKADIREVISTGWGTRDTHAVMSNLTWGYDNHIWGTVGYSGFSGKSGDKTLNFAQG